MKLTVLIALLCFAVLCKAQSQLSERDFNNLVAIGDTYSHNNNARGPAFAKTMDSLQTPALKHITESLKAVGRGDSSVMAYSFLARPSNDELKLWYVIREIHYNNNDEKKKPRPSADVAREVLAADIDERWLLDNYYYRTLPGLAMYFNTADLSKQNIEINRLGFHNDTEKGIFYLDAMFMLAGGRFRALQMLKKNEKILEYADRLPNFDGKPYYYMTLNIPDFDFIGYNKTESYNMRNIGNLYNTLIIHFTATSILRDKKSAQQIYFNSLLHNPMYFKYSKNEKDLQAIYDQSK